MVSGTEEDALYHQMTDVSYHPESSVAIGSNCIGLGLVEHKSSLPNPSHQQTLMKVTSSNVFKKISLCKLLLHSLQYTRLKKPYLVGLAKV